MFALLAVASPAGSALVSFFLVAVLVAVALAYLPRILTMDAKVWQLIRIVAVIVLLIWALALFGVI